MFSGSGHKIDEVLMTKRTLFLGRTPANAGFNENSDPNVCSPIIEHIERMIGSISSCSI